MAKNNLLSGNHPDIIHLNIQTLKNAGYSHNRAVRCALCHANKKLTLVKFDKFGRDIVKKDPIRVHVAPPPLRFSQTGENDA